MLLVAQGIDGDEDDGPDAKQNPNDCGEPEQNLVTDCVLEWLETHATKMLHFQMALPCAANGETPPGAG